MKTSTRYLAAGLFFCTCISTQLKAQLSVSVTSTDASCGLCDGTASASVAGGVAPYTYSWNDTSLAPIPNLSGLCPGSYTVTVLDAIGDTANGSAMVTNLGAVITNMTAVDENCFGCCDGSASVSASGGTPPYTYLWNDSLSQTTATATFLCGGVYCIAVTDAVGCTTSDCVMVSDTSCTTLSVSSLTHPTCGQCDGSAGVSASGGTPPYTYSWSTGDSVMALSGLCAGSYGVTVQDAGSCSSTLTVSLAGSLALDVTVVDDCTGLCEGSATVTPLGGTPPYTYLWYWPDTQTTATAVGLCADWYTVYVTDQDGCNNSTIVVVDTVNCAANIVMGTIFQDDNTNCNIDTAEAKLMNRLVRADPGPSYAISNTSGIYKFYLDSGTYTLTLIDSDPLRDQSCPVSPPVYTLNLGAGPDTLTGNDFAFEAIVNCPGMWVDIASGPIRPCFPASYTVNYCNNGTAAATNATLEIMLDPYMNYTGTTGNLSSQNGNVLNFNLGTVQPFACGVFYIDIVVDCDLSLIGNTTCIEAHVYPDSSCFPPGPGWDHSSISVYGSCVSDTAACFTVLNTGDPGTGDMQGTSEYRVYENNVLVFTGTFQITGGDSAVICWPSNGNTIRLEADQRPDHPGNSHPQDNIESCGDSSVVFTKNQILQTAPDDADAFVDVDCRLITGSYDPNDKEVVPGGLTETYHYIDSLTDLEYQIRFQNTGTDTAFTVVIFDTLVSYLDIATFRPGGGSHAYTAEIVDGNVLKFTFENILLPDSNINEPESHGFVKYKIAQTAGNAKGAVIENRAGIVFDFNLPVITNTAFNTIGNIDSVTCFVNAGFYYDGAGESITFTSISSDAVSYYWDFGDGNTSTDQNPSHTFSDSGSYLVTLVVSNSCGNAANSKTVNVQSLGTYIANAILDVVYQVSVYPNPFSAYTTFKIENAVSELPMTFELVNVPGERVMIIPEISSDIFRVDSDFLSNGFYLYTIRSAHGLIGKGKLVVKR